MLIQFGGAVGFSLWSAGDWDGALQLWRDNLADDPEPADRLLSLYGIVIERAARGEPVADALEELARVAADVTDPQVLWTTVDGPAFAAFAMGRLEEAGRRWRDGAHRFTFLAPAWLRWAAQTALERRDPDTLRNDLAALDAFGFHAPVADLQRSELVAGVAALDGRTGEAARLYLEALRGLREIGLPVEAAFAAIRMATVLDQRSREAGVAVDDASELLRRLRAVPFLERLEAVTSREIPEQHRASADEQADRHSNAAL